ncbi:MAG: MotA/TolQ/ExbB proton channel family protein [Verrucomicrobiota bacterium]
MNLSNTVIDTFLKGGPIMWPLLITATVAVLVVAERTFWWMKLGAKTNPKNLEPVYEALETGDIQKASELSRSSEDPILGVIWHGLNHHHTSLENALQVAAGAQIEQAGRFLSVLDTIITLAPLLGLLGTVTGIMSAFHFVGNEEVAALKVSGGIAEALIATAAGLTTAIATLIPFNFFNARLAKFTFLLQTAATNVEVLLKAAPNQQSPSK